MDKQTVIEKIGNSIIIAVIREKTEDEAFNIAKKCIECGVKIIEITFTVPNAEIVLKKLTDLYRNSDVVFGAGSVLNKKTAETAIINGAEFIVSPILDIPTIKICNKYSKLAIPGIMTPTEAITAIRNGADIVKLFPAETVGMSFIKALKAPIPDIKIIPTGGVDENNIGEWLKAGAFAVGLGSQLTKGNIEINIRNLLNVLNNARKKGE